MGASVAEVWSRAQLQGRCGVVNTGGCQGGWWDVGVIFG